MKNKLIPLILLGTIFPLKAYSYTWEDWKSSFYQRAAKSGVSSQHLKTFIKTVKPYEQAIQSDKNQAEFKKFIWDYLKTAVSADRVKNGRQKLAEYQEKLLNTTVLTGISPQYLISIWGMETNYGSYTGNVPIADSMATLAYEGRRRNFFELQLIALLKLVDQGDVPSLTVKGSWAGGMGHTQFIPTTYLKYKTDGDSDGHSDPWNPMDALSSTAHFLEQKGWQSGYTWGREVMLTSRFNYLLANDNQYRSLSEWKKLGIKKINQRPLANDKISAKLFVPAGATGPKFLVYKNFDVIKKYNNSNAYALAVSLLADQIAGKPGVVTPWPKNAKPVNQEIITKVQERLNQKGFNTGKPDGILGQNTKRALQNYQKSISQVPDGFLTEALYQKLVNNR